MQLKLVVCKLLDLCRIFKGVCSSSK